MSIDPLHLVRQVFRVVGLTIGQRVFAEIGPYRGQTRGDDGLPHHDVCRELVGEGELEEDVAVNRHDRDVAREAKRPSSVVFMITADFARDSPRETRRSWTGSVIVMT